MWFLTHIRRGRTSASGNLWAILAIVVSLNGCASGPKFSAPTDRYAGTSPGSISAPDFDDPAPSARIASRQPFGSIVAEPQPFQWKTAATSAGNRNIESITIGQGGYRTLVIGSLSGNDPLAAFFTQQLARYIHDNQVILGGIEATVIRNPNPDGAALHQAKNANGVLLNRQFHRGADQGKSVSTLEPEVKFLLAQLDERQPQRVIHIRTIGRDSGVVAASSGSASVGRDVSSWLGFRFLDLPGDSTKGTMERFLSQDNSREIVTFAVPSSADKSTVWDVYGDSVLNLLLAEDFETRKLARMRKSPTAADRRGAKHQSE